MRKLISTIVFFLVVTLSVIGVFAWLHFPHEFSDNTPLPRGTVIEPVIEARDATSKLKIGVRMNLNTLGKAINRLPQLPKSLPIKTPEGAGTITRSDINLYRAGINRLGLDGSVNFQGAIDGPAWTKVRSVKATYKGTTFALHVTKDWSFDLSPNVKAEILEIDVSGAPDGISKWVANKYVLPGFVKQANQFSMPSIKPIVEEAWKFSCFEWPVCQNPSISVSFRPVRASLGGPVIEETSNDLVFNLGLELRSSCSMKPGSVDWRSLDAGLLPSLGELSLEEPTSTFRIPLIANIESLASLFTPQTILFPGGSINIRSLDLSEFEGILYARLNADLDAPSKFGSLFPKVTRCSLIVKTRPSCDPMTGEIHLDDLAFIPESNSYLVKRLSKEATKTIETAIAGLAPVYSGYLCNRTRTEINLKSESLLKAQVDAWAKDTPDFSQLIKAATPHIRNIDVKPYQIYGKDGHLILVLWATADLGLAIQ